MSAREKAAGRPAYVPDDLPCPRCGTQMVYVAKRQRLGEHCRCPAPECDFKFRLRAEKVNHKASDPWPLPVFDERDGRAHPRHSAAHDPDDQVIRERREVMARFHDLRRRRGVSGGRPSWARPASVAAYERAQDAELTSARLGRIAETRPAHVEVRDR